MCALVCVPVCVVAADTDGFGSGASVLIPALGLMPFTAAVCVGVCVCAGVAAAAGVVFFSVLPLAAGCVCACVCGSAGRFSRGGRTGRATSSLGRTLASTSGNGGHICSAAVEKNKETNQK